MNETELTQHNPSHPGPHAGMPSLDDLGAISWFEFASPRWFYVPVAAYCGWLAVKHFGLTLPTNANPAIPFSGLVGESKTEVLDAVQGDARDRVASYVTVMRWHGEGGLSRSLTDAEILMLEAGMNFPVVVKPDIGMRGAGVQVAKDKNDLRDYTESFPEGGQFLIQTLVADEGEAGVFYVRHPEWNCGKIISLTLKYFPRITGDGKKSLEQLIHLDPRAGKVPHLYEDRHKDRWQEIIPEGEEIRLAFAGNHCRGTIFRSGNEHITPEMTKAFDKMAKAMGEFYVGRFDVRFSDFDTFRKGEDFTIIEVNGAGGEATHIWDGRMSLSEAYKTLRDQFRHIYEIGAKNRNRGFKPSTLKEFLVAWFHERKLTSNYPMTH